MKLVAPCMMKEEEVTSSGNIRQLQRKSLSSLNKKTSARYDAEEFQQRHAQDNTTNDKLWHDSSEVKFCGGKTCGAKFSLTNRKHHCRECGECCIACHEKLLKMEDISASSIFSAKFSSSSSSAATAALPADQSVEAGDLNLPAWVEALVF
eukprot:gene41748-55373_t